MTDRNAEDIASFTKTIGELKDPFLNMTDTPGAEQNIGEVIAVVQGRLDELYAIIKGFIDNGNSGPDNTLHASTVYKVFEKRRPGIFGDLNVRPDVKEDMKRILDLHFKEYTYTPSSKHITSLKAEHVPVSRTIVSNEDEILNNNTIPIV